MFSFACVFVLFYLYIQTLLPIPVRHFKEYDLARLRMGGEGELGAAGGGLQAGDVDEWRLKYQAGRACCNIILKKVSEESMPSLTFSSS